MALFPQMAAMLSVLVGVMVPCARAQLMPNYRIGVGSALFYDIRLQYGMGDQQFTRTGTNTIYVLGQSTNGHWKLALSGTMSTPGPDGELLQTQHALNLFEMTERGRILDSDEPIDSEIQFSCFVPLPDLATNVLASWDVHWASRGETHQYQFRPESDPARGKWIWSRVDSGLQNDVYGVTRTATALFNAQAGLLERMESRFNSQVAGRHIQGSTISQLRRSDILLNFKLNKLIPQAAAFQELRARYMDTLGTIVSSPSKPVDTLKEAAGLLGQATNELTYPIIAEALERERVTHQKSRDATLTYANEWRARLGLPGEPWASETFDGTRVEWKQFAGHVTVLHFWHAENLVTVRGLRRLDALRARFEGEPVKVLSVNFDAAVDAVPKIIAALGVEHPVIKGAPLLPYYQPRRFPTLLLFDTEGALRDVRFGANAYRLDALETQIKTLLKD